MNYLILKIRIKIDRHHVLTDFFPGTVGGNVLLQ